MIIIENTIISDEIRDVRFCCQVEMCKGACCVEGDAGAPLLEEEISSLEDCIDLIKPYMQNEGVKVVERIGVFDYDMHSEYVTPLIGGKDCIFVYYTDGIARCAIERAYENNKTDFRKPISCHLYPIRINKLGDSEAVNYHQWQICQPACRKGRDLNMPLYKFLREPLIRKFGNAWYQQLVKEIENI